MNRNKIILTYFLFFVASASSQHLLYDDVKIEAPIPNKGILPDEYELEKIKGQIKSIQLDDYYANDYFGKLKKDDTSYSSAIIEYNNMNSVISIKGKINYSSSWYPYDIRYHTNFKIMVSYKNDSTFYEQNLSGFASSFAKIDSTYNTNYSEIWIRDNKGYIVEYNSTVYGIIKRKKIAQYNEKNKITEYKSYNSEGKLECHNTLKYDTKGNIIEKTRTTENEDEKLIFIYDSYNRLVEESRYYKGNFGKRFNYKYDSYGNKIEEKFSNLHDNKSITTFQYNSKGKKISSTKYDYDGELSKKLIYKYDNYNRLIEVISENDSLSKEKEQYNYDKSGNLIEKYQYDFLSREFTEKFDIKGNLVEKISVKKVYSPEDNDYTKSEKTVHKYEYDSKGNWIKRIIYHVEASKTFPEKYRVTERIITYK
jgi:hypothetical protein